MKKCPFCAELIQPEAIKCKHCNEWLDNPKFNDSSIGKEILATFSKALDFIKEKNRERLQKKSEHLYEPTDSNPLIISDLKLYGSYLECTQKFSYDDVALIVYEAKSNSTYGIPMDTKIKSEIYFTKNEDFLSGNANIDTVMRLNHQKLFGIIGEKKLELINYIVSYLQNRTFKNRLLNYVTFIRKNGYLELGPYKLYINGDLFNNKNKLELNLIEAYEKDLIEYGSEWWGKVTTYDPYIFIAYHNKKPITKFTGLSLRNNVSFNNICNQDVIDMLLHNLLSNKSLV